MDGGKKMRYGLCDDTWDGKEREAIRRVAESGHYSMGEEVRRYEEAFAESLVQNMPSW